MLPNPKPKLEHEFKENIKHINKNINYSKKMIDHHTDGVKYQKLLHDKIIPKFYRMGYTANYNQYLKEAKTNGKMHLNEVNKHTLNLTKANKMLEMHKSALKALKPSQTKTGKVKRNIIVHTPAVTQITANIKLLKDGRYYQRLGKLMHLAIDRDAQEKIKNIPGAFKEKISAYTDAYKAHPLYNKMNKFMKKAARRMHDENHTTSVANDMNMDSDVNLMHEIYTQSHQNVVGRRILPTQPDYQDILLEEIAKHPKIGLLSHLRE